MAKKTIPLPDWDQLVAPVLHRIENNAIICRDRARHITSELTYLMSRPAWLTRAQAELGSAKKELQEALARIEAAEKMYVAIQAEEQDD
jgi:hypothetical protein